MAHKKTMKIVALDVGDRWIGVAISDPLGILARPYTTIKAAELFTFIETVIPKENVSIIVVGLPTTLRGTHSEQTKKIIAITEELEKMFTVIEWKLWDERFSSQQAAKIKSIKTKEDKLRSHALAAALILSSYLEFRRRDTMPPEDAY